MKRGRDHRLHRKSRTRRARLSHWRHNPRCQGCDASARGLSLRPRPRRALQLRLAMAREIAFEMAASSVRFGPGVTREVGMDLVDLGVRRALVVTDPDVARLAPVATCSRPSTRPASSLCSTTVSASNPPTSPSAMRSQFARAAAFDGFVAVGGGSAIDTAKAANLYTTYPPAIFSTTSTRRSAKPACTGPAQTAGRGAHDRGNRKRDHRRQHLRSHDAPRQDRHRQPTAQADAGFSIRTTRERCRRRSRRPAGSTS